MRNINELIGIIKGINFDEVINDKEVMRLQTWVDRNRNLVYDRNQTELINLLDNVLEDHIINEQEKNTLITKTEEILKEMGDNTSKIYELNGIIDGIICDGVVNEAEVYRLKEWMDYYSDTIRNHSTSAKLCKAIDLILEDGVVTEEEQQELLEMLNVMICDSQFETKIEYLCDQIKNRKNIGVDLIDLLDNEYAMEEIHRRAERELTKALVYDSISTYKVNREIIVVSLVLIAMLEYDGNYYKGVRSVYTDAYERYSEQKIEGFIRSILSKYKEHNDSGERTRIINVVLENAIVAKEYLPDFFVFIYDIYKMNFEYDLSDELYEDFEFVFDGLRNNMLSEGDNIYVTKKTYKLKDATKRLINKKDGFEALIKLSIIIVKLIDKYSWGKEDKIDNPYLKAGYEGWIKTMKTEHRKRIERKKTSEELESRWKPKYVLYDDVVYLITPTHRVKAYYNYKEIAVIISVDGEEIYRNNQCDIREIIGGYQINPQKIEIINPLGKLEYRLVAGNETIYSSRDELNRSFIVFNSDGQEISNNTDYEGTVHICCKQQEKDFDIIAVKEFYCIGYKLVRTGDIIKIGENMFSFSKMIKPGVLGEQYKNCYVHTMDNDMCLPIYSSVDLAVFESQNLSDKFEVIINNNHYKLADMKYTITYKENLTKYVLKLNITESGFYTLEINQILPGKKNRILQESFVCDPKLKFIKEKISDGLFRVIVNSDLLQYNIDMEVAAENFNTDFINFRYNGKECSLLLPFDFGFYKINDGKWNSSSEDLWIDDITINSTLSLLDSSCDGLQIFSDKGKVIEDNVSVLDKGLYKSVSIGFLNSYKNENTYIMLVFTSEGKQKVVMFCYNKCMIDENRTEILSSDKPKSITITPVYYGKNKVFFEMLNKNGEVVYKSRLLDNCQKEIIEDFNSFEEYNFVFYEKNKGLILNKNPIYQCSKIFYIKEDYVKKEFKIRIAYFCQYIKGKYTEKAYYFNKAYVRILKMKDDGQFEGEIYVKKEKGEYKLHEINPVEVEICSEVIDDTMDVYMTKDGDGLLIDFEHRGIMNSTSHRTAPDIFLFTLYLKG